MEKHLGEAILRAKECNESISIITMKNGIIDIVETVLVEADKDKEYHNNTLYVIEPQSHGSYLVIDLTL